MIVQVAGVPAETVHVDPALHREPLVSLLTGRKLEGQGNGQPLWATFRREAVPSGRQLELEASGSAEVLFRSLLVCGRSRRGFEIPLFVGQIEPARKSSIRA